jgi:hypothetical protein
MINGAGRLAVRGCRGDWTFWTALPLHQLNEINAYLQRAREIIGDRTHSEIAYDDSVVAHLSRGMDIKQAIRAANREHPEEALEPGSEHWADLAARYEYILEHKAILKSLGMQE